MDGLYEFSDKFCKIIKIQDLLMAIFNNCKIRILKLLCNINTIQVQKYEKYNPTRLRKIYRPKTIW